MELEQVEARLGYRFQQPDLLAQALSHASVKAQDQPSNERLEFLGDAVLGLIAAERLFRTRPQLAEGALTRLRASAVSAAALAGWAEDLGLAAAVRVGRGLSREALPSSVLADALEAVLGAVYLDGGLDPVRRLVEDGLGQLLDAPDDDQARDWKSLLQEQTQQEGGLVPSYELVAEAGPDHAKEFLVRVLVAEVERGRGRGSSKKAAEQEAARRAYRQLAQG